MTAIPETLVQKYKCMIKAGVPMDRVQQLAGIETGASGNKLPPSCKGVTGVRKKKTRPRILA